VKGFVMRERIEDEKLALVVEEGVVVWMNDEEQTDQKAGAKGLYVTDAKPYRAKY
jgi:hypothetical protein